MASSIECPDLISHDSVQNLVGQVWTGSIVEHLNLGKILLALFFPPYLLSLQFLDRGQNTEFRTGFDEDSTNRYLFKHSQKLF